MIRYFILTIAVFFGLNRLHGQSTNHFEMSFRVDFDDAIANQVAYITFPNVKIYGSLTVTINGGYNHQLNRGVLKRRFAMVKSTSGYFSYSTEVLDAHGPLAEQWHIGEYDEANNRIPIYHLNSNGNIISVKVEGQLETATAVATVQSQLSISTPVVVANAQTRQYKAIMQDRVGIGTVTPTERLSVNGNIRAKEIKVEAANWPDYVFKPEYSLASLSEVEDYINTHGHLPGIPDAAEVQEKGVGLSALNRTLLEKIEELTLHLIENEKEKKQMAEDIGILKAKMEELSKQR